MINIYVRKCDTCHANLKKVLNNCKTVIMNIAIKIFLNIEHCVKDVNMKDQLKENAGERGTLWVNSESGYIRLSTRS